MKRKFTVYPKQVTAASVGCQLYVVYSKYLSHNSYSNYTTPPVMSATVSGDTLLTALKNLVDELNVYVDRSDIDSKGWTAGQVLQKLRITNGDMCDYIMLLEDKSTGKVYIKDPEVDFDKTAISKVREL